LPKPRNLRLYHICSYSRTLHVGDKQYLKHIDTALETPEGVTIKGTSQAWGKRPNTRLT